MRVLVTARNPTLAVTSNYAVRSLSTKAIQVVVRSIWSIHLSFVLYEVTTGAQYASRDMSNLHGPTLAILSGWNLPLLPPLIGYIKAFIDQLESEIRGESLHMISKLSTSLYSVHTFPSLKALNPTLKVASTQLFIKMARWKHGELGTL